MKFVEHQLKIENLKREHKQQKELRLLEIDQKKIELEILKRKLEET